MSTTEIVVVAVGVVALAATHLKLIDVWVKKQLSAVALKEDLTAVENGYKTAVLELKKLINPPAVSTAAPVPAATPAPTTSGLAASVTK
jgi:hypothetical protein